MSPDSIYFGLTYSTRVLESLEATANRADVAGQLVEIQDASRLVDTWLRADPETMGEPYRVHKSRELTEYIGFIGPLIV